jgi:hypothetical protein
MGGFSTAQASPDNTANGTLLAAARPGRCAVTVINHGTTDVFVGQLHLTTLTGALLTGTKGASVTIPTQDAVYGITAGAAQTVSIVESY